RAEQAAALACGSGPAGHRLASPSVTCRRTAPTIASVTTPPNTSLATCRGGLWSPPKPLTVSRSLVNRRNCRRSLRAALPCDLTLRWIPRRRRQEPRTRWGPRQASMADRYRLNRASVRAGAARDRGELAARGGLRGVRVVLPRRGG